MKHRIIYCTLILVNYLVLSGCINLGPDYRQPDVNIDIPEAYQSGFSDQAGISEKQGLDVSDRWWTVFGDPELNLMVAAALENNWDIKQAAARVLESRARYVQTRADRFPTVDAQGTWDRRRFGGARSARGNTVDTYELTAPAIFEVDLWRRLAKASEAAWDEILQEEETRHTVAQTIVAETVRLYLQIEASERRLQIAFQSIEAFERSLQIVNTRYQRGLSSTLDIRQARRILAQAEALVPEFRQQLGIAQQQSAVLIGQYPTTEPARFQPQDYYRRLEPVPPGLPSTLLLRRPDIRAAENSLKALNERIGVARAARFPSITLTGSYGWSSDELSSLIEPDSVIWNLTRGIVQPVFDAGQLKARQRAAEARYQQGVAEYAQAVLNAFQEVESALLTRKMQLERRQRELKFLEEARATQRVAQNRYLRGLTDYLDVLDAQQTRFQAEDRLVLVDLAIYSNRVALHRALGGGWARPEPMATKNDGIFFDFVANPDTSE
jgi:multidrug efflux system outer membrane protein